MLEMKIELREPEEMRVAAKFLAELAEASETARARRMADYAHIAGAAIQGQEQVQAVTNPVQPKSAPKPAPKVEPVVELEPEPVPEPEPEPIVEVAAETQYVPKQRPKIKKPLVETKTEEKTTGGLTIEELRAKAALLSQAGHSAAIKQILASYKVGNVTAIPKEKHQEFNDRLEGLNG